MAELRGELGEATRVVFEDLWKQRANVRSISQVEFEMNTGDSTDSYFRGSSFWAAFFAIVLFYVVQGIALTFKNILILTGGSLLLGFFLGRITTKFFDRYLENNYEIESIPDNFKHIYAVRTKIRFVSIALIFIVTFLALIIFFA